MLPSKLFFSSSHSILFTLGIILISASWFFTLSRSFGLDDGLTPNERVPCFRLSFAGWFCFFFPIDMFI